MFNYIFTCMFKSLINIQTLTYKLNQYGNVSSSLNSQKTSSSDSPKRFNLFLDSTVYVYLYNVHNDVCPALRFSNSKMLRRPQRCLIITCKPCSSLVNFNFLSQFRAYQSFPLKIIGNHSVYSYTYLL
jgi:hypothetical protein